MSEDYNNETKINIKEMCGMVCTFVVVFCLTGSIICLVDFYTQPIIKSNKEKLQAAQTDKLSQLALINKMISGAEDLIKLGSWKIHENNSDYFKIIKNNTVCGYSIISYGKGYSSLIETFIVVDPRCTLLGIEIVSQSETPGLGDGITSDEFKRQFIGCNLNKLNVSTTGEKEHIQAIAGATISSKAVAEDAVLHALTYLRENVLK